MLAGNGSSNVGNQLWTFTGTGAGNWTQIDNRGGQTGGVGIFAVDPNNPNNLYASNFAPGGLRMVFSNDGGLNWSPDPILDTMMTGGGAFQYQTTIGTTEFTGFSGYAQPTLLAYDPNNANNIVAGGHDSGVFLSTDGGSSWRLLTDPFTSDVSGVPHLPRPRFAHFNGENPAAIELYIGTVGRGVWRIDTANNFDLDPDRFEPNDMLTTSTVMGSLAKITERDLTIDSQTDVDFFQYTAQDTGKLIINTYFNGLQGDLDLARARFSWQHYRKRHPKQCYARSRSGIADDSGCLAVLAITSRCTAASNIQTPTTWKSRTSRRPFLTSFCWTPPTIPA